MLLTLAAGVLLLGMQGDTTVAVSRGMRLELNQHQGSITVRTWDRPSVKVAATGSDRITPRVVVSRSAIRVTGVGRRHGIEEMDFTLTVPRWLDLDLSTHQGDIRVDGSEGRLSLHSVEGDVEVQGGRELISVQTVEGIVTIRGARGRVEVNAVEGDLRLTGVSGSIRAQSVDGDVTMEDVDLTELDVNTVDGDISFRGPIRPSGRYRINTHDGDIVVNLTQDLNAVVSVSTFDGNFEAGFPVTITGTSKRQFRFTVGSGAANLDLESFDGNIYLRRAR